MMDLTNPKVDLSAWQSCLCQRPQGSAWSSRLHSMWSESFSQKMLANPSTDLPNIGGRRATIGNKLGARRWTLLGVIEGLSRWTWSWDASHCHGNPQCYHHHIWQLPHHQWHWSISSRKGKVQLWSAPSSRRLQKMRHVSGKLVSL